MIMVMSVSNRKGLKGSGFMWFKEVLNIMVWQSAMHIAQTSKPGHTTLGVGLGPQGRHGQGQTGRGQSRQRGERTMGGCRDYMGT